MVDTDVNTKQNKTKTKENKEQTGVNAWIKWLQKVVRFFQKKF